LTNPLVVSFFVPVHYGCMERIETAEDHYEQAAGKEQSAAALASELRRRAEEMRQQDAQEDVAGRQGEIREETRGQVSAALEEEQGEFSTAKHEAQRLDQAATDLQASLGGHNPTMKELPGSVAGQAQLDSGAMWVDTDAIRSEGDDRLIDKEVAEDIGNHEEEHQHQSAEADADSITVNTKEFAVDEAREVGAMSVQKSRDFLSAQYKQIIGSFGEMDGAERQLVRRGKFRALEAKRNGNADWQQLAA
jgi:hypothetical protein